MIEPLDSPLAVACAVALMLLCVAVGLCTVRIARGPSLPDRVVALDLLSVILVGAFVVLGIAESQDVMLRVATVLALINFIGTIGFALYIGRRAER